MTANFNTFFGSPCNLPCIFTKTPENRHIVEIVRLEDFRHEPESDKADTGRVFIRGEHYTAPHPPA